MTIKILLNLTDVARAAGVDRVTIYNWQKSGRFSVKPYDDHKPSRWHIDDINAWLKHSSTANVEGA